MGLPKTIAQLKSWFSQWFEHERWLVILPRVFVVLLCMEVCLLVMGVFWI